MKKIISLGLVLILVLTFAGCGKFTSTTNERIYSFSGKCDELRIINGVAVVGGNQETFYGGQLEIKTSSFKDISEFSLRYYIFDGTENRTIMDNVVKDETSTFELQNQETGQITGNVLNYNIDVSAFEDNLFFELITTNAQGETKTFTVPMEVTSVLSK